MMNRYSFENLFPVQQDRVIMHIFIFSEFCISICKSKHKILPMLIPLWPPTSWIFTWPQRRKSSFNINKIMKTSRISCRPNRMVLSITISDICPFWNICWTITVSDIYGAPFYYKTPILWYHKIDFLISQNWFCDITKLTLWYQKSVMWYQIICVILWYKKIYYVISILWFFDITKSIINFVGITNYFWYHKNWICDITK